VLVGNGGLLVVCVRAYARAARRGDVW
jgi:hypothetical protein